MSIRPSIALFALGIAACASGGVAVGAPESAGGKDTRPYVLAADVEARVAAKSLASVVFAGGCFWCLETAFEPLPGVVAAISGYSGGTVERPTYEAIGSGGTGHYEAVRIVYDPAKISYARLLEVFWHNVDPTQDDGQFCDRGPQYRAAVFVSSPAEKKAAETTRDAAAVTLGRAVVTQILPFDAFWAAENYHQDFFKTHPDHYRAYREGCGRDRRLRALWGETVGH